MNRLQIIAILEEQEYPKFMINNTIKKIEALTPSIASAFSEWMDRGVTPHIEIEGYSYDKLLEKFNMKPVGAFLTLDWLMREPEKATKALEKGVK